MNYAIKVEGISKQYAIGALERRVVTMRDELAASLRHPLRSLRRLARRDPQEHFWALRDLDFEVAQGEVLGVVGRNGAGKSTLMKILSRITEPTRGRARVRGRLASLLEVGTGFHPELSGRENIYLNATILGMRRAEIAAKFDEIVAFSGIERFLDTPVKHYSSGMYVRLAFAVAAHVEAEVLLVDEVLAVGDAEFQRRCLGKMGEVARGGRTVLLVSHNMAAIEDLCARSVLLRKGQVDRIGPTRDIVAGYLSVATTALAWEIDAQTEREGTGNARITRVELLEVERDRPIECVLFRQSFRLRIGFHARLKLADPRFGFALLSDRGERVFLSETSDLNMKILAIEGDGFFECVVFTPNVLPGTYFFEAWIVQVPNVSFADHIYRFGKMEIGVDPGQAEQMTYLTAAGRGSVLIDCRWERT